MGASAFGSITALAATPPAPGVAEPSFLYADLQSRALWLGVDPLVNPIGAVLIADIVQTQADILAAEVNAKLYTDAQITTRAPLVHTHYASDIDDFEEAVDAAVADNTDIQWIPGTMMMWGGLLSAIGVDQLAGWALCDGSSLLRASYPKLFANIGTIHGAQDIAHFSLPDLRDRFIIGAGNKLPGTKNAPGSFTTDFQGVHAHTINGHAITVAQMAAHGHYGEIGPGARFYGATYGGAGGHNHQVYGDFRGSGISSSGGYLGPTSGASRSTSTNGSHDHACYVDIHAGVSVGAQGGNATHSHGCQTNGGHEHTITSAQIRDNNPYYAVAYIMKL